MTQYENIEKNDGGPGARAPVARASCPEPSSSHILAQTSSRIANIAGVVSLALGPLLVIKPGLLPRGPGNGKVRLVQGPGLSPP